MVTVTHVIGGLFRIMVNVVIYKITQHVITEAYIIASAQDLERFTLLLLIWFLNREKNEILLNTISEHELYDFI